MLRGLRGNRATAVFRPEDLAENLIAFADLGRFVRRDIVEQCAASPGSGAVRAMAREIRDEWRLAQASPGFLEWLSRGAPSDDRVELSLARSPVPEVWRADGRHVDARGRSTPAVRAVRGWIRVACSRRVDPLRG